MSNLDPHPVPDEDPEQHIGEPMPDPWDEDADSPTPEQEWVVRSDTAGFGSSMMLDALNREPG